MEGILPLVGSAVGFLLTVASIAYGIQHFRITRAMSYIERMNTSDMAAVRAAINAWLDGPGTDLEKVEQAEKDHELYSKLLVFVDIITELGIAYRYRSVSRPLVREIWYPFIPNYWKRLQFFIYARQVAGVRTGYWFRYLAEEIQADAEKREKTLAKRYQIPKTYFSDSAGESKPTDSLRVSEKDAG